ERRYVRPETGDPGRRSAAAGGRPLQHSAGRVLRPERPREPQGGERQGVGDGEADHHLGALLPLVPGAASAFFAGGMAKLVLGAIWWLWLGRVRPQGPDGLFGLHPRRGPRIRVLAPDPEVPLLPVRDHGTGLERQRRGRSAIFRQVVPL